MHPLIIEPEAEADIIAAREWYEQQRPGLGHDFDLCLEAAFQRVQQRPRAFQKVYKNVRRALVNRFPYIILFVERKQNIVVIAAFHARRDPRIWQERTP